MVHSQLGTLKSTKGDKVPNVAMAGGKVGNKKAEVKR